MAAIPVKPMAAAIPVKSITISEDWRYNCNNDGPNHVGPDGRKNSVSGRYTDAKHCTPSNGNWILAVKITGTATTKEEISAVNSYIEYWSAIDNTIAWITGWDGEESKVSVPATFSLHFSQKSPLFPNYYSRRI